VNKRARWWLDAIILVVIGIILVSLLPLTCPYPCPRSLLDLFGTWVVCGLVLLLCWFYLDRGDYD
jgi:hypothetical protein